MDRLVSTFRVLFIATLLMLSMKLMFGNPITGEIHKIDEQTINFIDCSIGRHANPFFRIENMKLKFYVLDHFVYQTKCNENQESNLIGSDVTFLYFQNSPNTGKVIEISLSGRQIYNQHEFTSKSFATGVILFFVTILFGFWCFFSAKKA